MPPNPASQETPDALYPRKPPERAPSSKHMVCGRLAILAVSVLVRTSPAGGIAGRGKLPPLADAMVGRSARSKCATTGLSSRSRVPEIAGGDVEPHRRRSDGKAMVVERTSALTATHNQGKTRSGS